MKALLVALGNRVQAAFPPNRICILLATPILAASAWVSATVAANIPSVQLPVGVVAGVMGTIVLATATLLYKWYDQWQKGEPIDPGADIEQAIRELLDDPESAKTILSMHPQLTAELAPDLTPLVRIGQQLAATAKGVEDADKARLASVLQGLDESLREFVARAIEQGRGSVAVDSSATPPAT